MSLNCSQIRALKGKTLAKTENKTRENTNGREEPRHPGEKGAAMARGGQHGPWWSPWPGRGGHHGQASGRSGSSPPEHCIFIPPCSVGFAFIGSFWPSFFYLL